MFLNLILIVAAFNPLGVLYVTPIQSNVSSLWPLMPNLVFALAMKGSASPSVELSFGVDQKSEFSYHYAIASKDQHTLLGYHQAAR